MRDIASPSVTTPTDREVAITRVFDAPRRLVWEAWTNPKYVTRWMLGPPGWTMPVCEVDLRPGGAWRFIWRRADGSEMGMRGVYREVSPPERLVHTESWGADWPETVNTLSLSETAGQTTAVLTVLYESKQVRDRALQTGMEEGLATSYERLANVLAEMRAEKAG